MNATVTDSRSWRCALIFGLWILVACDTKGSTNYDLNCDWRGDASAMVSPCHDSEYYGTTLDLEFAGGVYDGLFEVAVPHYESDTARNCLEERSTLREVQAFCEYTGLPGTASFEGCKDSTVAFLEEATGRCVVFDEDCSTENWARKHGWIDGSDRCLHLPRCDE